MGLTISVTLMQTKCIAQVVLKLGFLQSNWVYHLEISNFISSFQIFRVKWQWQVTAMTVNLMRSNDLSGLVSAVSPMSPIILTQFRYVWQKPAYCLAMTRSRTANELFCCNVDKVPIEIEANRTPHLSPTWCQRQTKINIIVFAENISFISSSYFCKSSTNYEIKQWQNNLIVKPIKSNWTNFHSFNFIHFSHFTSKSLYLWSWKQFAKLNMHQLGR